MLLSLGVIDEPVQWLTEPSLILPIAMLLTIWAGVGYYAVIFLAGLQNIPEELYDAARIDGCNDLQKHWHVTLPGLRPQIVFVAVISSLAALKVFDEIYVLTNQTGGILDSGTTVVFYLWKQAFQLTHAGYASAIAIVLLVHHAGVLDRQRPAARARTGGRLMAQSSERELERVERAAVPIPRRARLGRRTVRRGLEATFWYAVLIAMAVITVFPFAWILLTSLKGPADAIFSVPPQFLPNDPTLATTARSSTPADPDVLPQQHHRRRSRDGPEHPDRRAGRVPAREAALPGPRADLLPAARRR